MILFQILPANCGFCSSIGKLWIWCLHPAYLNGKVNHWTWYVQEALFGLSVGCLINNFVMPFLYGRMAWRLKHLCDAICSPTWVQNATSPQMLWVIPSLLVVLWNGQQLGGCLLDVSPKWPIWLTAVSFGIATSKGNRLQLSSLLSPSYTWCARQSSSLGSFTSWTRFRGLGGKLTCRFSKSKYSDEIAAPVLENVWVLATKPMGISTLVGVKFWFHDVRWEHLADIRPRISLPGITCNCHRLGTAKICGENSEWIGSMLKRYHTFDGIVEIKKLPWGIVHTKLKTF